MALSALIPEKPSIKIRQLPPFKSSFKRTELNYYQLVQYLSFSKNSSLTLYRYDPAQRQKIRNHRLTNGDEIETNPATNNKATKKEDAAQKQTTINQERDDPETNNQEAPAIVEDAHVAVQESSRSGRRKPP